MSNQIRVFIGSEPKTEIPKKVLEYSILKNTKSQVVFPGLDSNDSWSERAKEGWRSTLGTGFSLLRWEIPERCNFEGFAIYLDADMIVLADIKDLWLSDVNHPNNKCSVWCTWQVCKWFPEKETPETSVMLIDCAKAKNNQPNMKAIYSYIDDDPRRKKYVNIMRTFKHKNRPQRIDTSWNRLNTCPPNHTNILHYTKEPEQPWYNPGHSHKKLWEDLLVECLDKKIVTKDELKIALSSYVPHTRKIRGQGLHPYYKKYL